MSYIRYDNRDFVLCDTCKFKRTCKKVNKPANKKEECPYYIGWWAQ